MKEETSIDQTRVRDGLVAFFDILGYQSFLENNEAEVATSQIINIVNDAGSIISGQMIANLSTLTEADKKTLAEIQWLVFSDTILMVKEWDRKSLREWAVFTAAASKLCRHMFEFGLPLRGAIKIGKYLISKSCFAGKPIVDAYRAETSLDLAACCVDQEIMESVGKAARKLKAEKALDEMVVSYLTPLKEGRYQKMALLNYLIGDNKASKPVTSNLQQFVLNSFWAHNKDITLSAERKAKNTENFFRYLQFKYPELFDAPSA
jgi:hypothetical protein